MDHGRTVTAASAVMGHHVGMRSALPPPPSDAIFGTIVCLLAGAVSIALMAFGLR